jgi:hypothetical protein
VKRETGVPVGESSHSPVTSFVGIVQMNWSPNKLYLIHYNRN